MRILITGCNGQVGTELVKQGQALNHEIVAFDQDRLDITQADSVQKIVNEHQPDIIVNAAAYTAVDKAEQEIEVAYAVNKEGATNLAVISQALNIPLFHISTDYIFDGKKQQAYKEDDPASPTGVYGQSKWQGEQAIREILKKYIILRVSWVFATEGNNFVKTMFRLAIERDEISVVADQHGGPTCAADIASTLLKLAEQALSEKDQTSFPWGTYHYSGTPTTTWHGFAEKILTQGKKMGLIKIIPKLNAITTADYPTPAVRPENSKLDCSKIKKIFDIEQPDWQAALNNTLKEWKKL
ncbi:MAG: dTDP-4-dehydrorhamnose reductase [Gammaproteobacteria bacterium]|nr:dTDP-4-dehydrorhamnose reductase [Gammaproteobacteria bacterium]